MDTGNGASKNMGGGEQPDPWGPMWEGTVLGALL